MSDIGDFIANNRSSGAPAFKWETVGDKVTGTVTGCRIVDGQDMKGQDVRSLVIDVTADDGAEHTVWVKAGQMFSELANKLGEAKPGVVKPVVEVGDRIGIGFKETRPAKTAGFAPMKVYEVGYKAAAVKPNVAPSVSDLV